MDEFEKEIIEERFKNNRKIESKMENISYPIYIKKNSQLIELIDLELKWSSSKKSYILNKIK